ncbi:hypothetical protein [Mesonia mobilis]|uniref:hypothetical protein n=1 Tax=Mesonia mobilis TaxID=369791 RepID=UPI0026F02EBD|nr:hypothetical protein [Mesonia mobilis]
MAVDNFDKKIKQQLEARKIEPSARAWDQLAAELEVKEEKSTKKYWWLGIAASFLGGILITSFFFNQQQVEPVKVVNQNTIEAPKNKLVEVEAEENSQEINNNEELNVVEKPSIAETENKTQPEIEIEKPVLASVDNSSVETKNRAQSKVIPQKKEEQKAQEIKFELESYSSPKQLAQTKTPSAEEEAAQLLDDARERVKIRNFNNYYNRISAQNLLENIEVEDKQSFKEKVFYALESGFHRVKNSVIE